MRIDWKKKKNVFSTEKRLIFSMIFIKFLHAGRKKIIRVDCFSKLIHCLRNKTISFSEFQLMPRDKAERALMTQQ